MTLKKGTWYSVREYDEATRRLSKELGDLTEFETEKELDERMRKELGINYDYIKSVNATIYRNLVKEWESKRATAEKRKEKPLLSFKIVQKVDGNAIRRERVREYAKQKKIRVKTTKKRVTTQILHKGKFTPINKIIIVEREGKLYTRKKSKAKKQNN